MSSAFKSEIAPTKKIKQMDMKLRDQVTFDYRATVENDVKIEDLLDPMFWSDVAHQSFQGVFNAIEVVWRDKSQMAELVVIDFGKTHARVFVKNHYVFNTGAEAVTIDNEVFILKHDKDKKWRIFRKADGEMISDDHETKDVARAALDEYIKSAKG